ncbi:MAG: type III pantothenate kinase [Bacteroidia bacterium]
MNLTIDIGNTSVKTALFKGNKISKATVHHSFNLSTLKAIAGKKKGIQNVIVCSVKDYPIEWKNYLDENFNFIELDEKTPVPIKNEYLNPSTLGKDRLAAAVGSTAIFPGKNILAINAGTCITYDFVDKKGVYRGGSISPGLDMRFKAMHTFTRRLPLLKADTKYSGLIGKTTEQSMRSGAQQGMLKEIEGIINAYRGKYPDLQIIISGGSLPWLKKSLKAKINSQPFLTLKGLNVILASCLLKKKA